MKFTKAMLGVTPLFMGAGEKSQARCHELTCDLIRGFSELSMAQQFPIDTDKHSEAIINVELAAAKIYFALTGRVPQ